VPHFTDTKILHEKRHLGPFSPQKPSKLDFPLPLSKIAEYDLRGTQLKSTSLEHEMTVKTRVPSLEKQRNNLPFVSLGDKPYRKVDYQAGFFKDRGLVVGSTHQFKVSQKGKASDLVLDLKATTGKPYAEKTREEMHELEIEDVKKLRAWERSILQEVDKKYDPDDDSTDVEAIAERQARQDRKAESQR
jgi:hypothetical protein